MTEPNAEPAGVTSGAPTEAPHTWRPERFMVITAHPDDSEFGPAGIAATWIDAGSVGRLVVCTSGDQGGEDPTTDPLELSALRENEQRAAASVIGYDEVVFLHQPDGALANDLALREHLVREIRRFRPDAVLTHDPEALFHEGGGINHTDHRTAGLAAVDAVYPAARNPMAFPWLARDGLAKHEVRRVYLFWSNHPDVYVDVSATLERKVAALQAHASQLHEPGRVEEWVRSSAGEVGAKIGVAAAERLRLIVVDDDPSESEAAGADAGEAAREDAT
jgi:LmbE family N-acetylglucosaminyl deacetylase